MLDLARSRKPDLILLDLMLPKMDGLAVCRELERDAGTVRIPIIMLTARGEDVDRILGFELGADDYVHFPVLLCGFVLGGPWGLAVGFAAPLLRSVLFGMPPMFPVADRKSTRLNSSHSDRSRMPSSA